MFHSAKIGRMIKGPLIKLLREPNMNLRYSTYYSYASVPQRILGTLATLDQSAP